MRREGGRGTIAALAERWGFCDAAYLGRAFRETYGMTPGDYHAMHAAHPRV
ncbi:helix-turn-helix domain-containing protein [uncultured Sphingomonas sp.]|uniref:AraC family transcriptional regulator n=1 Tax=uncultured Sphingomonas sp. TaxID=158754 RepID=UPI0025E27441|nr:helix-turn-helix domain-containing protein [uncultured Sphingomonas sp.]